MSAVESAVVNTEETKTNVVPERGMLSRMHQSSIARGARKAMALAMLSPPVISKADDLFPKEPVLPARAQQALDAQEQKIVPAWPVSSVQRITTPLEPLETKKLSILVDKWSSDSYLDRQGATDFLQKYAAVLDTEQRAIIQEATRSENLEVKVRALHIMKLVAVENLWKPSQVKLESPTGKASNLLMMLGAQTGNKILIGDQYGSFQDTDVTLSTCTGSFWELADEICAKSKNHPRCHYDTRNPGIVFVSGDIGKNPRAYSGPFRAKMTSARRFFSEELDFDDANSEKNHTFQLNMEVMWEDQFRLVAYRSQAEIADAVGDDNQPLQSTNPSTAGWNVVSPGTNRLAMELRLHPPSVEAKNLKTLRLKWGAIAVGKWQQLRIRDLTPEKTHYKDDGALTVESIQESTSGRYEVTLRWERDMVIPDPQEILFNENEISLMDGDGQTFTKSGQTNMQTDRGVRMRLNFTGKSPDSRAKQLFFTYPGIRAQRDLEIDFKNGVPLPTGRPK